MGGVTAVRSEKLVAEAGAVREPRGSSYQATASGNCDDFMCAVVSNFWSV
jgi:hypothetical protein